ncbi:MAG: hypothetical protein KDN22_10170, partial [Verrucomicrobiae bacterium]|nr:hypothetical protein [Verrucomicrobiae bacterium]
NFNRIQSGVFEVLDLACSPVATGYRICKHDTRKTLSPAAPAPLPAVIHCRYSIPTYSYPTRQNDNK